MWMQDLRLALRTLRRSPGFTVVAILILGIGIGGIVSSFTIVDGFLLAPLPFEDPEVWSIDTGPTLRAAERRADSHYR